METISKRPAINENNFGVGSFIICTIVETLLGCCFHAYNVFFINVHFEVRDKADCVANVNVSSQLSATP